MINGMILILKYVDEDVPRTPSNGVYTVNSQIFARVLYSRTSHMRSFAKKKSSRNDEISLLFTDTGQSYLSREFLT